MSTSGTNPQSRRAPAARSESGVNREKQRLHQVTLVLCRKVLDLKA
jgi:hypothetical protein